jgi:hypothetical protein
VDQLEEGTVPDKELIIAGALAKAGKHESAAEILLSGKEDPTRVLAAAQAASWNRNRRNCKFVLTSGTPEP